MASSTWSTWLLLVLMTSCIVVSVHGQSAFDGQWTANWGYGGSQYLCANPDTGLFTGVWSQAGLVVGTLSGPNLSVATGNWYEAGTGPCYTGTFNWTLSADGNTITGSFKCSDGTGLTNVVETRITAIYPTSAQCARLSSLSAAGEWILENNEFDVWDVCTGSFVSSYSFPTLDYAGDAQGYTWGSDYEKARVISGRWVEANGAVGVSIGYRTDRNELINLVWLTNHINAHLNSATTQAIVYTFVNRGSPIDCGRNSNLRFPYPFGAASRLASSQCIMLLLLSAIVSLLLVLY